MSAHVTKRPVKKPSRQAKSWKCAPSVTTNASEWESLMGIVVYAAVTVAVFAVLGLAQKLVEKL